MKAPESIPNNEPEHGIESAYYSNSPNGYLPRLECLCGFMSSQACISWQEAGEELDEHLAKANQLASGKGK